ncbi:uncharacterized protein BDR25DRAFT_313609 [Lindgomyces ingoldianus]|uniref:Uncharacterized protein n=1 Tax=Lindgomyces ingoldianus TaxID=673940 RepID=A0ACB6QXH7_9PLEO|nr:uncharacterized protein BDR25DRAFT_313609 [Lindgomyces ingoldianus]KAF2471689.1 hypothetical protein BDR25DRAFT_313609 [Lindgomyces ingoldianus]
MVCRLKGDTERHIERQVQESVATEAGAETQTERHSTAETTEAPPETDAEGEKIDGVTITKNEARSETESHKSYQATIEDDFEDLGTETASTISGTYTPPTTTEAPVEQ